MRSSFFAVTALAHIGASVAATKKHEMKNDFYGLYGPRHHGDKVRSHQRRLEGEGQIPPFEESDSPFYTAESLEYFKNGMDKTVFEWVKPDEIVPGGTTCGFMFPPLGTTPGITFPQVEVYVCMRFADIQPASKGNAIVHCGGPGSTSDCPLYSVLSPKVKEEYNFVTIDQRGMGRSWPSFAHAECHVYDSQQVNGTLQLVEPPEFKDTDFTNIDSVKLRLEPFKRRVSRCWQCHHCHFHMNATQEDGSLHSFHFLEYSGTLQLAEDIERIRILLNAPVMHTYGVSYGTSVMGAYATLFPHNVGIFVLDSNVNPFPDSEYFAWTLGEGIAKRISYAIYSCSARNAEQPGSCPVEDLPKCIGDINALLAQIRNGPGKVSIAFILDTMLKNYDVAVGICTLAAAGDADGVSNLLEKYLPPETDARKKQMTGDPASQPTPESNVYGNPDYGYLMSAYKDDIPMTMVLSQDFFSGNYDADYFAKKIVEFANLHTGAGTGLPVQNFFLEFAKGFYWPKGVPVPPFGTPSLTGIVSGQLYDSATPYLWTQNMKRAFQYTFLLTSQGTSHGLNSELSCQQHINDYFDTGFVQFVDGTVCGQDFADESVLTDAFKPFE